MFDVWQYKREVKHFISGRVAGLLLLLKSVRSFFARSNRFRWDGWKLLGSIFTWKRDDDDPFCSLADKNHQKPYTLRSGWWLRFWVIFYRRKRSFRSNHRSCVTKMVSQYVYIEQHFLMLYESEFEPVPFKLRGPKNGSWNIYGR